MTPNFFEQSKFNYFLQKIEHDLLNVHVQNKQLILTNPTLTASGSLKERLSGIVNYLSSQAHLFNSSHLKLIKKIQSKFTLEAQEQDRNIQNTVQPKLNQLSSKESLPENDDLTALAPALQIAPVPQNRQAFKDHLQLVLEHFPRYQLHNDLSVYDTAYKSLPLDWDFDLMHDALNAEFSKYQFAEEMQTTHLSLLKEEILHLLKIPVPIKMSIIIETCEADDDNRAMFYEFMNLAKQKLPCVVNRKFFHAQIKAFTLYPNFKLEDYDIYLQKDSDLCVVIPKGQSLKDLGFNPDCLNISTGNHLVPCDHRTHLAKDIQSLLINETEKQRFFRLVAFAGHGNYPGYPFELDTKLQGTIAGLNQKDFQQSLQSLKDKNIAFMHLTSCFGGGVNSTALHLPDETLPCPIYIQSSFETITCTYFHQSYPYEYDFGSVLKKAQNLLFPIRRQGTAFATTPRQLLKSDRKKLAQVINITDAANKFTNLGTLLLPSSHKDIPKVAYTLANTEEILDVSHAFNSYTGKKEGVPELLEDANPHRKAYLFSEPILPITLSVSGVLPMILLSQGGTVQHVVKKILAPQQDIEDIVKETFNAFQSLHRLKMPEPAIKIFYIAEFKCRLEGKAANLSHVMIKSSMNERELLFQLEGEEGFRRFVYIAKDSTNGYAWMKASMDTLSLNEGLKVLYLAAAQNPPDMKTLRQVAAGKTSKEDILEAMDQFFFSEQMPPVAKLYSALLKDKYSGHLRAEHFKKILLDLKEDFGKGPLEKWYDILRQGFDMATPLKIPHVEPLIRDSCYTPLMLAVQQGNLERVQTLLKSDPNTLEAVHLNGSTAVAVAIFEKKYEIAKWLIEQGAQLNYINRFGVGPIYFACTAENEFILWLLQKNIDLKGDQGAIALDEKIKTKNWKKVEFLIDHFVGADSQKYAVLAEAISNNADINIIEKLLQYPHLNINQPSVTNKNTALHFSVYKQDVQIFKLLLEKGADLNAKNFQGKSPLHFASIYGNDNAIEFTRKLTEAGASMDLQDEEGKTALHWAIMYNQKTLIEFLIRRGASLQIEDKNKQTPLELAAEYEGLLEFILEIPRVAINAKNCKLDVLFQQAILKGNLKLAKALIIKGVDINKKFEKNIPPLSAYLQQIPSETDPTPVIQFFLEQGAYLNLQDNQGETVIHAAMRKQDLRILKCLREANVLYDFPLTHAGETPFMLALAGNPTKEFLQELLQDKKLLNKNLGAILKYSSEKLVDGSHPLAAAMLMQKVIDTLITEGEASSNPSLLLYKAILDKDADAVNNWFAKYPYTKPKKFYGLPILHAALYLVEPTEDYRKLVISIINHYPESLKEKYIKLPTQLTRDLPILKALVRQGAEIDYEHAIFSWFDLEFLKMLEEKGMDLSGQKGLYYLDLYTQHKLVEGMTYLLPKIKASPHSVLASAITQTKAPEILDPLMNHPHLDLQKADPRGSPLYWALITLNTQLIKTLLSKQAIFKPSSNRERHATPFHLLACLRETDEVIEVAEMLMATDYKTSLNALSTERRTPLYTAIIMETKPMINFLIKHGADINCPNKIGKSPLQQAIAMDEQALATLLINKGAEVNTADTENGKTPLHEALLLATLMKEDKVMDLIKLLIDKGAKWDIPNKEGLTSKDIAIKLRLGKVLQFMQNAS